MNYEIHPVTWHFPATLEEGVRSIAVTLHSPNPNEMAIAIPGYAGGLFDKGHASRLVSAVGNVHIDIINQIPDATLTEMFDYLIFAIRVVEGLWQATPQVPMCGSMVLYCGGRSHGAHDRPAIVETIRGSLISATTFSNGAASGVNDVPHRDDVNHARWPHWRWPDELPFGVTAPEGTQAAG
jgi:hypothetical protein